MLLNIVSAQAYEFKHINSLFSALKTDYTQPINIKNICVNGSRLIQQFDSSIKVYHSSTKAFLYQNSKLVSSFNFPKNDDITLWQDFMVKILGTSLVKSPKILSRAPQLEASVIQYTLKQLDRYSRLENNVSSTYNIDYRLQEDILYIKYDTFEKGISNALRTIILQYPQAKGLILDLRKNRGGSFDEAIKTADLFLDNVLIAYSSKQNTPSHFYNATKGDIFHNRPIAVLTGEYTASAAEIVAAALSEQDRAILIGTKTFGKGSIQNLHDFQQQKLYLTSGYFFTPSGRAINNIGIQPDIVTIQYQSDEPNTKSNELSIALDFIKKRIN